MPADVRINDVTTTVDVVDASALLSPQIMERIVRAVLERLQEQMRAERDMEQERGLGAGRDRTANVS